ncbi:MAG: hypothetical protein HQM14_00910 [SAR324 cluster bacterium]|nr:hypothetical protein [SAR324 cluster bacterium]
MLSKLKGFLGQQKQEATTASAPQKPPDPTRHSQYVQQKEKLIGLYRTIQINNWNEQVEQSLQALLDSLQKYTISDYLVSTYSKEKLEEYKQYAVKEFEAMGIANRERVQSLVDLSDEDMHKTIYECLFLCDVNPSEHPPFELSASQGFDKKGNPILQKHEYSVFTENALHGVAGINRFLPSDMYEGNSEKNIEGMKSFLQSEYADLASQSGTNSKPTIKAMTTIGSLGGIGHKPDSDMDLQVIFNTNPEFDYRWNDADFLIALVATVLHNLQHNFLEKQLSEDKRKELKAKVVDKLKEQYWDHLNEEERSIITAIFPSSYQQALEKEVWEIFNAMTPPEQGNLLWRQVMQDFPKVPYMETYLPEIKKCFPLLKSIDDNKLLSGCFPYSAETLTRDKMAHWLTNFFQRQLGSKGAQRVFQQRAKKKGIAIENITTEHQTTFLLEHLSQLKQRFNIIKSFLNHIAENISLKHKDSVTKILAQVQKQFDPQNQYLKEKLGEELQHKVQNSFRSQIILLIDTYLELEATYLEAKSECALHRKIQSIEAYLTRKYPNTEVHLFTNILRNQRKGQHTPFLVSPEGSMAYDLMLNDFLLNPAVILAGSSPMPFDLPHDLKVMLSTGILPANEWTLTQSKGSGSESFNFQQLCNWGSTKIPWEKLWAHAIPIYLRESEKVSHRNLPKALLNCWWLEILCCMDKDSSPTSMTRLLWHPEQRHFIKEKMEGKFIQKIEKMEQTYPLLIRDPWWLKFTEMLSRFTDPSIQKQIIFCFAQHIRLSDIIDFNNDCKPVWLDKDVNWRTRSLVSFYEQFFPDNQEQANLMKFAQGRDDIGNQMENELKQSFLDSMNRTEHKLVEIGNTKALQQIIRYLGKVASKPFDNAKIKKGTQEYLEDMNRRLIIADERVLKKDSAKEPLNAIEKQQLDILQKDRLQMRQILKDLAEYYAGFGIKASPQFLEKIILESRIKLAGDPLENVIFKYHFERNFRRKLYQVPLPISKSLSIPRKKIMLNFQPETQNWTFKSILSKADSKGGKGESEMEMFAESLVEGLARCVFSGYVGFTSKNLTSFEKPATHHKGAVANTPITHQDIQDLVFDINEFFRSSRIRPQELLENIHYITEVFMVCGVNAPSIVSLVIRDNFGDSFVVNYDLSPIKVKFITKMMVTNDENFPRFFLQLNSKEGRERFREAIKSLKIPLEAKYKPKFKAWVNFGDFDLTVAPKNYRIYVNGIANALWPVDSIGTPDQLIPQKLDKTLDQIGKTAIQRYQKMEAEKKALTEKARQKQNIQARAYMDRKRSQHGL